jgi:hypothetical protein
MGADCSLHCFMPAVEAHPFVHSYGPVFALRLAVRNMALEWLGISKSHAAVAAAALLKAGMFNSDASIIQFNMQPEASSQPSTL